MSEHERDRRPNARPEEKTELRTEAKAEASGGPVEQILRKKLREGFTPCLLEIENESSKHHASFGAETHFKVLVVAEAFVGLSQIERHRGIFSLFQKEMSEGLHALSLQAFTPTEWEARLASGAAKPQTPNCPHS